MQFDWRMKLNRVYSRNWNDFDLALVKSWIKDFCIVKSSCVRNLLCLSNTRKHELCFNSYSIPIRIAMFISISAHFTFRHNIYLITYFFWIWSNPDQGNKFLWRLIIMTKKTVMSNIKTCGPFGSMRLVVLLGRNCMYCM